jgi:hypothetical protein
MTRAFRTAILSATCGAACLALLQAQGRGGGEWTTSAYDAQRSAWLRADARLTPEAVKKGEFAFLWKAKFENEPRQLNSLTTPIILDRLIGYRGFKALAFVGGSEDRVFAIDTDLARPYWTTILNYSANTGGPPPSSWGCPGGLIATLSRRTVIIPPVATGRGGGGGRAGARNGSAVGEPGRGAAVLAQMAAARAAASAAGTPAGRGAAAPATPGQAAPGAGGGRAVAPIGFGGVDPVFAVGSDGLLHTLLASNGVDAGPAVPFLPPHAKPSSLLWGDGIVYTTTSDGCGAAPNAVWAIDLTSTDQKPVTTWRTEGPSVAGTGPAFGNDGTLYVALARGDGQYSSAVVALDRYTLQPKDWFAAPDADFNASPIVFRDKDKEYVAVTGNDGRLYLLDAASLGGSDHKTPLHVTGKFTAPGAGAGLATWEDEDTRWILAPVTGGPQAATKFTANGLAPTGSVVAFKLTQDNGAPALQPVWRSRDLMTPLAPIVVNGMVVAVSSGEYRPSAPGRAGATLTAAQRAQRSVPAVLYILDGASGKTLWSSGTKITSFARAGVSAAAGQVYLVTYDNHLYAFGIPMEH